MGLGTPLQRGAYMFRRVILITVTIVSTLALAVLIGGLAIFGDSAAEAQDGEDAAKAAATVEQSSAEAVQRRPGAAGDPLLTDEEAAAITVDRDIVYREVDGTEVTLDVCTAPDPEGLRAAVVLIHGGAFTAGDKDRRPWPLICRWLADAGYVAVNINYRLAPEHEFPAAIEDVQAAVRWTRANAGTYGIDPARVGALGGSAGANLAQLLATSGEGATTEGSRVASVISLSGASELTAAGLQLGEPRAEAIERVLDYLGCTEIENCPAAASASPISHIDPTDPPFLLAHAREDRLPVEQTERMAEALSDAGLDPEVLIRPGRAHASLLLFGRAVQDEVLDFLDRTLG